MQGLSNSDRLADLQARLDALPADLDRLFDNLLSRLEEGYFKKACETFRLLRTHHEMFRTISSPDPTLLDIYYADEEDIKSSFRVTSNDFGFDIALERSETMRTRLNARCRGFVEVHLSRGTAGPGGKTVGYLHRTARDFIESTDYWPKVIKALVMIRSNPKNVGQMRTYGFRRLFRSLIKAISSRRTVFRAPSVSRRRQVLCRRPILMNSAVRNTGALTRNRTLSQKGVFYTIH